MLKHHVRVALLAVTLAMIPFLGSAAVPSATVSYLQTQSSADAWVIMALRASSQSVSANALAVDNLATATDTERVLLGVVAGGGNPYQFNNVDLVAKLDSFRHNQQLGEERLLNDDIFGILAYVSAGVSASDQRVIDSRNKIVHHQNTDGGWGYAVGATSDSNITAMATMALLRAGLTTYDTDVSEALVYLRNTQQSDGGYAIFVGQSSDTASTAWVISALQTAGIDPRAWISGGLNGFDFLNATVRQDGSYAWKTSESYGNSAMTAYAAIAHAGTGYPVAYYVRPSEPVFVAPAPVPAPTPAPAPAPTPVADMPAQTGTSTYYASDASASIRFRIEGATEQMCQGETWARTALEVISAVADQCNFTYEMRETGMGSYVYRIGAHTAEGEIGWLYRVNWRQPDTAAQHYSLNNGDYVTWYFGRFDAKNLRVKVLNVETIPTGARVHVLAESETNGVFAPVANVSLYTNQYHTETDANGISMFTLPPGYYHVSGMIEHHVRSHASVIEVR